MTRTSLTRGQIRRSFNFGADKQFSETVLPVYNLFFTLLNRQWGGGKLLVATLLPHRCIRRNRT